MLRISEINLEKFDSAIALTQTDYRDLFYVCWFWSCLIMILMHMKNGQYDQNTHSLLKH